MKFRLVNRVRLCAAGLLLCAATARAQDTSTTVIPVVGSVFGPTMIRWLTDVVIVNDTGLAADIAMELTAAAAGPRFFTLAPGETQRFTDIVGQAFGLDAALSPLVITTAGRRGLTIHARAYAVRDAEISPPQDIPTYGWNTWFPVRVLDGLAFDDDYRTNIGLVNMGEQPADFRVALQRIPGRDLAVTQLRLEPGALVHAAIQALFPLVTKGSGFTVVVYTDTRDTHVYGSVIENQTNSGRFIVPRIGR